MPDHAAVLALLAKWKADESGYDESVWPRIEAALREEGIMTHDVREDIAAVAIENETLKAENERLRVENKELRRLLADCRESASKAWGMGR